MDGMAIYIPHERALKSDDFFGQKKLKIAKTDFYSEHRASLLSCQTPSSLRAIVAELNFEVQLEEYDTQKMLGIAQGCRNQLKFFGPNLIAQTKFLS
jgi:hypothetical protein